MSELSGYTISVEGQYFVGAGEGKRTLSNYKFDINLPSMDSALSIIKNKILPVILPKMYPDYLMYRTHDIVDVKPFGNVAQAKAVLWQMNRPTIISYITENELPVNVEIYETLMELRQAVEMAEADPDNFLIVQGKAEKDFKLLSGIKSLNPDLFAKPEEEVTNIVNHEVVNGPHRTVPIEKPILVNNPPPELHTYNIPTGQSEPLNTEDALADLMA
ncbi:MAG: hypothetical protein HOL31_02070 [Candidatus Scalindua sp.]|jgi:hypothetical protein|nr:hypothetical protein [Candidatus Scalindua sp.]MBT7349688.1 hypothetical protein [candidate division WWE3 bacterium]